MRTRGLAYAVLGSLLCSSLSLAQDSVTEGGRTFTSDADFALGGFDGTRARAPDSDQLRLEPGGRMAPYLWLANFIVGTVIKVDTRTGKQVARYDSVLTQNWDGSIPTVREPRDSCNYPVATAVDARGDAFVANRGNCSGAYAAITKFAGTLASCVDRNGDGVITTSADVDGDGAISTSNPTEFLGQADECILWTKNYAVAEDQWRSLVVDADLNVWAAGYTSTKLYKLDGQTGALLKVIDVKAETGVGSNIQSMAIGPGGLIYTSDAGSSRLIRKINPNASTGSHVVDTLAAPLPTFGITVDRNGVAWLGGDSDSNSGVVRVDFTARTAQPVGGGGGCTGRTHGISVDSAGDVWAACVSSNRLLRVSSAGAHMGTWAMGTRPEGVAVGVDKRIWVLHNSSDGLWVVNPAGSGVLQNIPTGGNTITAADMTGFNHHNFVRREGSWGVVHDSGQAQAHWGSVAWNSEPQGDTPPGTLIAVQVRAANTRQELASSAFAEVTNGQPFAGIDGRFLEIKATLRSVNCGGEPVLSDLTIGSYNSAPVALCQERSVCAAPETCVAQVSVDNGSYDPDGDPITLAQSPAGPYGIGSRAVSLTASDANLSASCSASVQVRDCTPPAITCAPPVQAECTGNSSASVTPVGAQATDACSAVSVSGPGTGLYPLGSTAVTYTATDADGNTATCASTVSVVDTQPPALVLQGPANQAIECGVSIVEQGATATDVCRGDVSDAVQVVGAVDASQPGSYTLRYTVADPSGNAAPALMRAVTVQDTLAPTLVLEGAPNETVECGAAYVPSGASAVDACAGDVGSSVVISGSVDVAQPGSYTLSYTVTDPSGNTSPAVTRTVTVQDTQGPAVALNGPASATVECGTGFTEPGASAIDACAGALGGSQVTISGAVDTDQPGAYTLSYTAVDPSGNASPAVTRTVTVQDTQGPTLTLNGPATVALDCGTPFVEPGATANDLCLGDMSSRVTISGSVDPQHAGTYVLTYNATDTAGHAAPAVTRTVQVSDTQGPTLALNGANPMQLECVRDWYNEPGATAVDACAGDVSGSITITQPNIDSAHPGTYAVTYSATDGSGNFATAQREVRVQDTLAPELYLNGAASLVLECRVNTYSEAGAVAQDLCSGSLNDAITITGTVDPNQPGAYPLRYRVEDGQGLATERVRDVRVVDTQPPTLTLSGSSAPSVECSRDAFIDLGAVATDGCAGDITDRITFSGTEHIVAPGTYPITYNVTDPSGNAAPSVTRNVTVKDTKGPVVTINGQANMELECGVDTYTELGATAYDACQGDMTSALHTYGSGANPNAVGTYSIQYGVWDASGNTTMALRTVKVLDRTRPAITLVGSSTVQHECASGEYVDQGATASDFCYGDLTGSITKTGWVNAWALGTYPITYNVQDSALLKATPVTRTVQVVDTQGPTMEYRQVSMWPADHSMHGFTLADCITANDACDGGASANNGTILSIYSDEPEDVADESDGGTAQDIVITGKSSFSLRAERQSTGNGRVYGVRFELKDKAGNVRPGLCRIMVPASLGETAGDSGPEVGYTVSAPPALASAGAP